VNVRSAGNFVLAVLVFGVISVAAGLRGPSGGAGAQVLVSPSAYLITGTTPATGATGCGPAYSAAPATPLYCKSYAYGTGTNALCGSSAPNAANIYINGANAPVPSPVPAGSAYWADAGIGSQFLFVSWGVSTGRYPGIYITSLMPSQPFNIIVQC
jgi:hypothetical protein